MTSPSISLTDQSLTCNMQKQWSNIPVILTIFYSVAIEIKRQSLQMERRELAKGKRISQCMIFRMLNCAVKREMKRGDNLHQLYNLHPVIYLHNKLKGCGNPCGNIIQGSSIYHFIFAGIYIFCIFTRYISSHFDPACMLSICYFIKLGSCRSTHLCRTELVDQKIRK